METLQAGKVTTEEYIDALIVPLGRFELTTNDYLVRERVPENGRTRIQAHFKAGTDVDVSAARVIDEAGVETKGVVFCSMDGYHHTFPSFDLPGALQRQEEWIDLDSPELTDDEFAELPNGGYEHRVTPGRLEPDRSHPDDVINMWNAIPIFSDPAFGEQTFSAAAD